MQIYERVFTGPKNKPQGLEFRYYSGVDFSITIGDKDAHGYGIPIIIRGICGGGFMGEHLEVVTRLMNLITQEKKFKRKNQFQRLRPDVPIVLFHEHQQLDRDGSTQIVFEKVQLSNSFGLVIRIIHRLEDIFYDFHISLINPHEVLQRDLFNDNEHDISSPVFAGDKDLDEISDFLDSVLKVQKEYYQSAVDQLLKQLPPIKSPSN